MSDDLIIQIQKSRFEGQSGTEIDGNPWKKFLFEKVPRHGIQK